MDKKLVTDELLIRSRYILANIMINDNIRKNRFKTLPYFVEGHILPEMGIC